MAIPIERLPSLPSTPYSGVPELTSSSGLQDVLCAFTDVSAGGFEPFPSTVEGFRPILQADFWLAYIKSIPVALLPRPLYRKTMRSQRAISSRVLSQLIIKILTITNSKFDEIKRKIPLFEEKRFHDQLQDVLLGKKCDDAVYTTARICAVIDPARTAEKVGRFCLKDQGALFGVAMACAREDGPATARNIQRFGIQDEMLLFEIFKKCGGVSVVENLSLFGIWSQEISALVFNYCRQQDEERTVSFFSCHPEMAPRRELSLPDMGDGWDGNAYQNPGALIRLTAMPSSETAQLEALRPSPLATQQCSEAPCGADMAKVFAEDQ